MHQSSIIGETILNESKEFGWETPEKSNLQNKTSEKLLEIIHF